MDSMLAVPVILRCRAGKSACGTRMLTCSVRATGCLQDLQASIEAQLKEDEDFAELLYRGSQPAIDSPLQDFIADKSLPARFQALYIGNEDLNIKLPDGKRLCISAMHAALPFCISLIARHAYSEVVLVMDACKQSRHVLQGWCEQF